MIADQPDLFSARPEGPPRPQGNVTRPRDLAPVIAEELIAEMINWLAQAEDWLTAEDLCIQLALPVNESSKRRLRQAAAESEGRICSGNNGYKLMHRCTVEEWLRFKHRMINQAIAQIRRVKQSAHHRTTPQQLL